MMSATGTRPNSKRRGFSSGFTLIELLIVLVVVALLAGLTFPKLGGQLEGWRLNTSARELQVFMEYLRERSVVEGNVYYLVVGASGKEYWGRKEAGEKIKLRRLGEQITLESEPKQIAFYPDGSIDKITLRVISADGRSTVLSTTGSFGSVKIQ